MDHGQISCQKLTKSDKIHVIFENLENRQKWNFGAMGVVLKFGWLKIYKWNKIFSKIVNFFKIFDMAEIHVFKILT